MVLGHGDPVEAELLGQDREVHELVHLAPLPAWVMDVRIDLARVQTHPVGVHELQGVDLVAERGHGLRPPSS
jgi:hypothetical protein